MTLLFPGLLTLAILILASGFFSGSETALFYLTRDELRSLQTGKSRERVVAELLRNPDRLLTAVLFWNLLLNLTYFAVSVVLARRLFDEGHTVFAGVLSIGSLVGMIIGGEVIPKSVSVVFHRRIAVIVSLPLALSVRVLDPMFPTFGMLTRVLRRTFWPHIRTEPYLHADDLERAVAASTLSAESIQHEQQVLHRILDLSEITVEEVMRPRGTYVPRLANETLSELRGQGSVADYVLLRDESATNDADAVAAAVPLASLTSFPTATTPTATTPTSTTPTSTTRYSIADDALTSLAEPVLHVPWCASLADALQSLRDQLCDVAVVVNEYGETTGTVTYEDIIDTILVPQPSRAKRVLKREPVLEVATGKYHVDGMTTLRYLAQRLSLDFDPVTDGVVTVAGRLHDKLEHLPQVGDVCDWQGCTFRVIDTPSRGKIRVMVTQPKAHQNEDVSMEQ